MPAREEYEEIPNKPQVMAAFNVIDQLCLQKCPIPPSKMELFTCSNIKLLEIKAPPRGKLITRALANRDRDWDIFIALIRAKNLKICRKRGRRLRQTE